MPLKITPNRSPHAKRDSTARRLFCNADFTEPSVSMFKRSKSNVFVAAWPFDSNILAASKRLLASELLSRAAARNCSKRSFISATVSRASAVSISDNLLSSTSDCKVLTASRRITGSGDISFKAASAKSISPRMRLLFITSSAVSGSGISASVTGSIALPSITSTGRPATILTASSDNACIRRTVFSSALDTALRRAAMRASPSPTTMAWAWSAVKMAMQHKIKTRINI